MFQIFMQKEREKNEIIKHRSQDFDKFLHFSMSCARITSQSLTGNGAFILHPNCSIKDHIILQSISFIRRQLSRFNFENKTHFLKFCHQITKTNNNNRKISIQIRKFPLFVICKNYILQYIVYLHVEKTKYYSPTMR